MVPFARPFAGVLIALAVTSPVRAMASDVLERGDSQLTFGAGVVFADMLGQVAGDCGPAPNTTAGMIGTAFGGKQNVDKTGFAVSGCDAMSYFGLPQSTVGQPQQSPLPGSAAFTADNNGAIFAFATGANRAAHVPQYDGRCAYGGARGGKVPGNPTLWRIVDGKLYLNITRNIVGFRE